MSALLATLQRGITQYHLPQTVGWFATFIVLSWLVWFTLFEPHIEGDTELLVETYVPAILVCLSKGQFSGCVDAGAFPLFQQIPSLLLHSLGVSSQTILQILAILSLIALGGSLLLIYLTLRGMNSKHLALAAVIVMLTGPLLLYSHSTFGEMLATFLVLTFTAATLVRAPGLVTTALFVLAGLTKETALPFLALIALTNVPRTVKQGNTKRYLYWLGVAVVITLAINLGFNYFRHASVYNHGLIRGEFIVPSIKLQLSAFLGLWLSPNGGLVLFWSSFVFLYLAVGTYVIFHKSVVRNYLSNFERFGFYVPLILITGLLLLLTSGFSRWYAPFGWEAWGPRLMLPWIPALLLMLLYFYPEQATLVVKAVLNRLGLFPVFIALVLITLPQLVVCFDSRLMTDIFTLNSGCSRPPVIQENAHYYYRCLQNMIWPEQSVFHAVPALFRSVSFRFVIPYYIVVLSLLWSLKQLVRNDATTQKGDLSRMAYSLVRAGLIVTAIVVSIHLLTRSANKLSAYAFPASTNPEDYGFVMPNPIDTTSFFVRQHYLDFLNREPDPGGFAHWQNTLDNCQPQQTSCDRIEVSSAFSRSAEFQQRGYFIMRLYRVALGRFPYFAEFESDFKIFAGANGADSNNKFLSEFARRSKFTQKYNDMSNANYVTELLTNAGVAIEPRPLIKTLHDRQSREFVLIHIVESEDLKRKYFNEAFVRMQYFGYLRRDPDAGYQEWVRLMNETEANYRLVTNGFLNSPEYRQRFGAN